MELIKKVLNEHAIEYFAVLSYSDLRETSTRIRERSGFDPKTAIIYLLPYYGGECSNLSGYAASRDYHIAIKEIGESLIASLKERFPHCNARSFGDHSPIDERHAAAIGGLGIMGDNALLINEKYGSYVFIGDVVTDIPPEQLGTVTPLEPRACMHCSACKDVCPTGILRGECCTCLSAITQRKGELTTDEAELMRKFNTVWGFYVIYRRFCGDFRDLFNMERIRFLPR
jgi:epoxyqueuosine reductase